MAAKFRSILHKTWRTLVSIESGVVLLILVVIFSALGAIVLQRPATAPAEIESAYSPNVLRILDAIGLTDIFHSRWFLGLIFLLSLCIVAASVHRFPNRWRNFSRPRKYPDQNFRRTVRPQKLLALANREFGARQTCLLATERLLQSRGYNPQRVPRHDHFAIFAERHRISELAVYVVHFSLLLIFFGVIANGLWGWQGTLTLNPGQSSNLVVMRNGTTRALPFSIRCDRTGQSPSQSPFKSGTLSGAPPQWSSSLTVVEAGKEVRNKQIAVNDPLLMSGLRFSLSDYGASSEIEMLTLIAFPRNDPGQPAASSQKREISLALHDLVSLDPDTTVRFAEFFPDYAARGAQAHFNSNQPKNPAAHLILTTRKSGRQFDIWLPQPVEIANNANAPWKFQATELKMAHFTEFEVSHQPGRWGLWSGLVLLCFGLASSFYLIHIRIWVVPLPDPRTGARTLWIGGSSNRDRNGFEMRFNEIVASIECELKPATRSALMVQVAMSLKK